MFLHGTKHYQVAYQCRGTARRAKIARSTSQFYFSLKILRSLQGNLCVPRPCRKAMPLCGGRRKQKEKNLTLVKDRPRWLGQDWMEARQ